MKADIRRWPLVILAPTHRQAVLWANRNGFDPLDERSGQIILIDYAGGDRCRGIRGGTYVVTGSHLGMHFEYPRWLERMREMLEGPCGFVELGNWDDALDGAAREALYIEHIQGWEAFEWDGP